MMKIHVLIIVSCLHLGQSMPQNRNRNRPGTRENPVGGFRPIVSENNNRNNAGGSVPRPRQPSRPSRPAQPSRPLGPSRPSEPLGPLGPSRGEPLGPLGPSRPSRPSPAQPVQPVNSRPRPTSFSPAFPAPELYTGPKYDEFGKSFSGADDYYLDDEIGDDYYDDDYYDDYDQLDYVDVPVRLPRPPNSNLGPDLQARLPNFGNVDILRATEVFRMRDKNKNIFVDPGQVNAGILPLAFENPSNLGLFPPLINGP